MVVFFLVVLFVFVCYLSTNKQSINAVTVFLQMCANTGIEFLSWIHMYIYNIQCFRQTVYGRVVCTGKPGLKTQEQEDTRTGSRATVIKHS